MQLAGALQRLADCNINARGRYGHRGNLQQWRRTFYYMRRLLHTTRSELDNMKKGNVLSKYWVVGVGLSDPRTSLRSVSAWCEEFAINGRAPIGKSSVSALRSAFGEILRAINRQGATTYAKGATHGFLVIRHLQQWKPQVSSVTTLKRKCYLVDRKALDALPVYPPDLDNWVIPKDSISLPADIYSDDMLIIDDGYDRSQLNIPGVMHIECGARWQLDRNDVGSPRASSSTLACSAPASPPDSRPSGFPCAAPVSQPAIADQVSPAETPATAAPAASQELPGDSLPDSEDAMPDIIANTKKCLAAKRWVSPDPSQPDTVEFWLRIFQVQMSKTRHHEVDGDAEVLREVHHQGVLRVFRCRCVGGHHPPSAQVERQTASARPVVGQGAHSLA